MFTDNITQPQIKQFSIPCCRQSVLQTGYLVSRHDRCEENRFFVSYKRIPFSAANFKEKRASIFLKTPILTF
jgi:hypothetical protein